MCLFCTWVTWSRFPEMSGTPRHLAPSRAGSAPVDLVGPRRPGQGHLAGVHDVGQAPVIAEPHLLELVASVDGAHLVVAGDPVRVRVVRDDVAGLGEPDDRQQVAPGPVAGSLELV